MHKELTAQCASANASVPRKHRWRKFIKGLVLSTQSSRESKRCQRLSTRCQRYLQEKQEQEEEEEGEGNSSSSEYVCCACNDVPFRINKRLRCVGCNKRRPSFSDTESVLDIIKMPVGTTNPVLKSSFSLTSLRLSTPTESPEHCVQLRLKTERAYHSLTKKSRQTNEQDKEQWRKSWGSGISQDGKEFWEGFQADYDYLMAQNILDRDIRSEVSVESGIPRAPPVRSHSEFVDNIAQLYSWPKSIQDSVSGKEENVTDWKLRAERLEEMQRQRFRLDSFKKESGKLITRYPDSEKEMLWRMKDITDNWESVEAMMGDCQKCEGEKGSEEKVKHEIRWLRKWLRELDTKLKPLSFQRRWTKAELEAKSKELMVLHRDIEGQKKIFSSLLKLCEKEESQRWLAVAAALERKYHLHYLRFLEWQCHVESLISQQNKNLSNVSNESDGEPVPKIARFARKHKYEIEKTDAFDGVKVDENLSKDVGWQMDILIGKKDTKSPNGQLPPDNTMMDAKHEKHDESILRLEDSASTLLGTSSRNTNILFSCAKNGADSRSKSDVKDKNCLRDIITASEPEAQRSEKPPNSGSFIWRHLDTDSEQEMAVSEIGKTDMKDCQEEKDVETTSSESGWSYKFSKDEKSKAEVENKPKAIVRSQLTEEDVKEMKYFSAKNIFPTLTDIKKPISFRKPVEFADEFVRCKPVKTRKTKRGSKEKALDSCDASGEYTEDSDEQKSEDNEDIFVSCRRYGSADGILEEKVPSEFFRRRERHPTRHQPLSMSRVSWIRTLRGLKPQASMSEWALNQVIEPERYYSTPGRGNRTIGGEDGSRGSSRRKRTKMRKQMNKKSDSGSDGPTLSDSAQATPSGKMSVYDSLTGTETEEEVNMFIGPAFWLGPSGGAVTVAEQDNVQVVEEQLSLNWDNYQEKYQSEAYSEEPPDLDTAKKLLDFGEDYGKFLGNQSDSGSTRSLTFVGWSRSKIDNDSDVDEVRQTLKKSLEQLNSWKVKFNKTIGAVLSTSHVGNYDGASTTFLDEIIGACKQNIECLTKLLLEIKDEMLLTEEHDYILKVIEVGEVFLTSDAMTSLLNSFSVQPESLNAANMVSVQVQTDYIKESWENLKSTAELHKAKQLSREMALLKEELHSLAATVDAMETTVTSREELEAKITKIQNELSLMKNGKNRLLQANVSVHRFLASSKHSYSALREEVLELYQLWDQTFCRFTSQLLNLQSLFQAWHDFEDHLAQLQCSLRTDTLKVLDFALKCGNAGGTSSFSLQDIAGILSDKESISMDPLAEAPAVREKSDAPILIFSTEGSLSDSGISDSGSEQELSEREKKLSQLKRLAKRLESILAPGSQALSNMFKRIEQTESELRELQKTCRDLIVRSASSTEEIRMIVAHTPTLGNLDLEKSWPRPSGKKIKFLPTVESEEPLEKFEGTGEEETDDGSDGGKSGKHFWFWRLVRYALPIQLALVALICITSILEPRCCDSVNNLELSFNPQLRYDSGPPPV